MRPGLFNVDGLRLSHVLKLTVLFRIVLHGGDDPSLIEDLFNDLH